MGGGSVGVNQRTRGSGAIEWEKMPACKALIDGQKQKGRRSVPDRLNNTRRSINHHQSSFPVVGEHNDNARTDRTDRTGFFNNLTDGYV
jgi:hypothetical protein